MIGINVFNSQGVPVIDDFSNVMYVQETGTTISFSDLQKEYTNNNGFTNHRIGRWDGGYDFPINTFEWPPVNNPPIHMRTISSITVNSFTVGSNKYIRVNMPSYMTQDSMVFYKANNNHIIGSFCTHFDLPHSNFTNRGNVPFVQTSTNANIPYMVIGKTLPTGATNTYGMQIRNTSSQVIYDSRYQARGIRQVTLVKKATIEDILNNNTTRTIALPKSMPAAWVCAPSWASFRVQSNVRYQVGIRQTSNSQFTLSRIQVSDSDAGSNRTFIVNDSPLFFMED